MKQPGIRNFGKVMDIAKHRALLTLGEAVQAHPYASVAAMGAVGAASGASLPGEVSALWREAKSYHGR